MLSDVDAVLKSLLRAVIPSPVVVRIGRPATPDGPVVCVVPRSVREDLTARTAAGWHDRYDNEGRVTGRQASRRRFRFHYQVEAAAADAAVERDLLDAALVAFVEHPTVPAQHLSGTAFGDGPPVGIEFAHPDCPLPDPHGTAARFALDVVLIASYAPPVRTDLAAAPDRVDLGVHREPRATAAAADRRPRKPRGVVREGRG